MVKSNCVSFVDFNGCESVDVFLNMVLCLKGYDLRRCKLIFFGPNY